MKTGDVITFAPLDPDDKRRWKARLRYIKVPGSGRPAGTKPEPADFEYIAVTGRKGFDVSVQHGRFMMVDWDDMHNSDDEEVRIVDS